MDNNLFQKIYSYLFGFLSSDNYNSAEIEPIIDMFSYCLEKDYLNSRKDSISTQLDKEYMYSSLKKQYIDYLERAVKFHFHQVYLLEHTWKKGDPGKHIVEVYRLQDKILRLEKEATDTDINKTCNQINKEKHSRKKFETFLCDNEFDLKDDKIICSSVLDKDKEKEPFKYDIWHPTKEEIKQRELDVKNLKNEGLNVNEIAKKLNISETTVRKYLKK